MNEIEYEILTYNYWEHFKYLKDVSLILPIDHPKRKKLEKITNEILNKIENIKK